MKDEGASLVKPETTLEGGTSDLLSSEVSQSCENLEVKSTEFRPRVAAV